MDNNEIINHNHLINVNDLNEKSRRYSINTDILKIKLHPHQLTLLQACINFENDKIYLNKYKNLVDNYEVGDNDYIRTNMAIIGDKVGSGKSYVILALILLNKSINNSQIESYGLNNIFINITSPLETYKTNLLVIPHNLYFQWKKYITTITDDKNFKYKLICRKKDLQEFIFDTKK